MERSFSQYKSLFRDNRHAFVMENLEMTFVVHCNSRPTTSTQVWLVETVRLNSVTILDALSDILDYVKSLHSEMLEIKNENAALKIQMAEILDKRICSTNSDQSNPKVVQQVNASCIRKSYSQVLSQSAPASSKQSNPGTAKSASASNVVTTQLTANEVGSPSPPIDGYIIIKHNVRSLPSKETLRGHSDSSFRGEGYIQCCVGVRLCDMYSNQELAEMHFMYGKADGNAALARRLYQERYPQRQCPDRKTFVRLHYRLCEYGKFSSPGLGRGRPRSTTPEVQEEILEAVNMTPSISTRRVALKINVPHTTVWRLLKEYQLYPYHLQRVQALSPADYPARVRFCQWFLQQCGVNPNFPALVLLTDEAQFTRDGITNFHNQHVWAYENPPATVPSHHQVRFSLNMWAGIIGDRLVGPHVLVNRLTGQAYTNFLENTIPHVLEDTPLINRQHIHFLHDGAPAHFSRTARRYLDRRFPDRWIDRATTANVHLFSADKNSIKHTTMRVLLFQTIAPGIPLPPQPVLTRWGTWLDVVNYYAEHYGKIIEVIDAMDSTDSSAVEAVKSLSSEKLLEDILFIDSNFKIVSKSIVLLESSKLQLSEALNIVDKVSQIVIQNNNSLISEKVKLIFYNDEVRSEDSPKDYPEFAFWLGKTSENPTRWTRCNFVEVGPTKTGLHTRRSLSTGESSKSSPERSENNRYLRFYNGRELTCYWLNSCNLSRHWLKDLTFNE
ncbi:hypothetical protein ANN_27257 [Periplaneta americana]|uniref:DUF4817 domain-containing protein n=1 Tax=Periplaneta americana TaxID=6978 RepID=A0ABQ8RXM3_PERAM|nr:hypothetical protein ANN_27257 [Periplaneta americana]